MKTFAEQLNEIRGQRSPAQAALAISPKLSASTYNNWERGDRTPPEWSHDLILRRLKQRIEKSRKPRHWDKVDWSRSNSAIAKSMECRPSSVSTKRAQLAPHTVQRHGKYDWASVDWAMGNHDIAALLGAAPNLVSLKRATHGNGVKGRRKPHPRGARWDDVDWSLPQATIAVQLGITKQAVSAKKRRLALS